MTKEKLSAARKAFMAYEKAVKAAQEALTTPTGFGGTIMTLSGEYQFVSYSCSECQISVSSSNRETWKFCPGCGAEIVRWDREPKTNIIMVECSVTYMRKCYQCRHEWNSKEETPEKCPKCKSPNWNMMEFVIERGIGKA